MGEEGCDFCFALGIFSPVVESFTTEGRELGNGSQEGVVRVDRVRRGGPSIKVVLGEIALHTHDIIKFINVFRMSRECLARLDKLLHLPRGSVTFTGFEFDIEGRLKRVRVLPVVIADDPG